MSGTAGDTGGADSTAAPSSVGGHAYLRENSFFTFSPLDMIDEICVEAEGNICDVFDELEREIVSLAGTVTPNKLGIIFQEQNKTPPSVSGDIAFREALAICKGSGMSVELDHITKADPLFCSTVRAGVDRGMEKVNAVYDKYMDKFEMYILRNIFPVPRGLVVDAEDDPLHSMQVQNETLLQSTSEDERKVDEDRYHLQQSIIKLRREFKRTSRARAVVRAEIEDFHRHVPLLQNSTSAIVDTGEPLRDVVSKLLSRSQAVVQLEGSLKVTASQLKEKGPKQVVLAGRKRRFSEMFEETRTIQSRFLNAKDGVGEASVGSAVELRKYLS
jgi:hypothetical protein|eukprot:g4736.t1